MPLEMNPEKIAQLQSSNDSYQWHGDLKLARKTLSLGLGLGEIHPHARKLSNEVFRQS